MAEYITKGQVIEWFRPYGHTDKGIPYYGLVTDIREMKAADVAQVVHGRWRKSGPLLECQSCGEIYSRLGGNAGKLWNYCPNCGAKMEGDSDES